MPPNPIPPFLSRVRRTIRRYHMIEPGDRIGVAVSGGIDSVALLDVLVSLRDELHIALLVLHLNHGIRGEEARRDQRFVQGLSTQYDLPYLDKLVDVPAYIKKTSRSIQEAARELRYRFFEEARETYGLDKVAIGQIADDQAETVLMRLIRGGGTRGLKGIPPVRGRYIRPLLAVWREELLAYAGHKGISFVQDSSNNEERYLRNRIRHRLLPVLQEYNPSIKIRLLHLAQVLAEDASYLDALTDEIAKGILSRDEDGSISIPIPALRRLASALQSRVLQRALALLSGSALEYPHVTGIINLIQEHTRSMRMALPGGYEAITSHDRLVIGKKQEPGEEMTGEIDLVIPGKTTLDGFGIKIEATIAPERTAFEADPDAAYLDYHQLTFPLRARSFRPGDNFIPLGMTGSKKLKNFFIDLKIPRRERLKIPLIISGRNICWVAGLRIDERFKVTPDTQKILRLCPTRL
jgi:tRNA(Ile)-lysidine synthase